MKKLQTLSLSVLLSSMLIGCGDSEPSSSTTPSNTLATSSVNKTAEKAAAEKAAAEKAAAEKAAAEKAAAEKAAAEKAAAEKAAAEKAAAEKAAAEKAAAEKAAAEKAAAEKAAAEKAAAEKAAAEKAAAEKAAAEKAAAEKAAAEKAAAEKAAAEKAAAEKAAAEKAAAEKAAAEKAAAEKAAAEKAAAVANSRPVFATGESRSFMAHDDGATKRGIAHSYSKNGKTFTDNHTHLTWQDSEISYKNYNQALAYCQSLTLDGEAGWRLPQMRELQTLQDFSQQGGGKYWSATEYPYNPNQMAYYIDFSQGFSADYGSRDVFEKSNNYRVRCVKGDTLSNGEFTRDDATQTVTDKSTNLMWEDTAHIERTSGVEDAINYCENLTLAGYHDWHLPNLNEYYTIADRSHYDAAVNSAFAHRLTITDDNSNEHYRAANYWTSTYYGQHPDLPEVHYYRTFNERDGASHRCRYYMGMHTRCVRSIK